MPQKPREIWEKATPLNEAWRVFPDSKLREELGRCEAGPEVSAIDFQKGFWETVAAVSSQLAITLDTPKRLQHLIEELRLSLRGLLASGRLIAFAFPTWPSEARIPRRIQDHFWVNSEINWEQETAQDQSYRFQKIRVIDPDQFPEIEFQPPIGRKTNREMIESALSDCLREIPKFADANNKFKIEEIRKRIKANNPECDPYGPGFHADTIRGHMKSYFSQNS